MPAERTLILLKPDAIHRRLCGEILTRIENKGYKIVGLKMLQVTPEMSKEHYAEHVERPFYPQLEAFITASPIIALCVEGIEAIRVMRDLMGKTNGRDALPGTIRGDFSSSRQMNLIHGSDGTAAAAREIPIYFRPEELFDYKLTLADWLAASDE
ncbi:MAG: nucleoside-diphosphate kinase [Planctomycetaceae bacterium]